MKAKIKSLFTANLGLKALALIFAAVLWLVVVNVDDPVQTKTYTSSVQILNADVLEEQSKYYTMDSNTITFRVSAKRSVLEKLSSSDFNVTADMNSLENDSRIPVDITPTKYASQVTMSNSTHYIYVNIGTNQSKQFTISAVADGQPATGYAIIGVDCTPGTITIEGPEETVSEIAEVRTTANVKDQTADFSIESIPVCYNSAGEAVDASGLTMSSNSVLVNVEIKAVKNVTINASYSGELPSGYYVAAITVTPSTVQIAGDAETLNTITSIDIPGEAINLEGITESQERTVDITPYLPSGTELTDGTSAVVTVKITIGQSAYPTVDDNDQGE